MADYKLPIITGTSLAVGDLLRWDGTDWVNYPDSNYFGHPRSACSVYVNSSQDIPKLEWTKITFAAAIYDLGSEFDITTDYDFTAAITGYYTIALNVRFLESATDGTKFLAKIIKNGNTAVGETRHDASQDNFIAYYDMNRDIYLESGDTIHIEVYHDYSEARQLNGTNNSTFLCIHRITY